MDTKTAVILVISSASVSFLAFHVYDTKDVIEQLKNENRRLERSIEELKSYQTEKRPAFTAYFDWDPDRLTLYSDEILKFNVVPLNRGNGYDSLTGIFTVPRTGVYLVSSTVRSLTTKSIHVNLWKNDERLVYAIGHEPLATGSFSISIALMVGDRIFIRHDALDYAKGEVLQRGTVSMFSAVFISD